MITDKFELREDTPVVAFIGVGSNFGDSEAFVRAGINELRRSKGITILDTSPFFRSKPFQASGEDYINAVIKIKSLLNPDDLLSTLQFIENQNGRNRSTLNAPRTLDLDLIFFGHSQIDSPRLKIPHPRWRERAFVLLPLHCIAPEWVSDEMLKNVQNKEIVQVE